MELDEVRIKLEEMETEREVCGVMYSEYYECRRKPMGMSKVKEYQFTVYVEVHDKGMVRQLTEGVLLTEDCINNKLFEVLKDTADNLIDFYINQEKSLNKLGNTIQ